eukprot:TRINITY_DN18828_c0_g1_i1.p1 TRINITY_DN18828_c0_g1~~TRINITY_DN18828_c0_g1_i1.p1  ORF type:complete len:107 (-),score=16.00 TRINITY_DN18828_c0_g1_i1:140-460(-)
MWLYNLKIDAPNIKLADLPKCHISSEKDLHILISKFPNANRIYFKHYEQFSSILKKFGKRTWNDMLYRPDLVDIRVEDEIVYEIEEISDDEKEKNKWKMKKREGRR